MHPWGTDLEVTVDKRSPVGEDKSNLLMRNGSHMESQIRSEFYDPEFNESGAYLYNVEPLVEECRSSTSPGAFNLIPHKEHDFLFANVDCLGISRFGPCVVEIKNVSPNAAPGWSGDEPPKYHWVQCQAHMEVLRSHFGDTAFDHCFLVGMIANRKLKIFIIQRDDEFISGAIDRLSSKWNTVQNGTPDDLFLALDSHEKTLDAVKKYYPGKRGQEVVLEDVEHLCLQYEAKCEQLAGVEAEVRELKAKLMFKMGDAVKAKAGIFKMSLPLINGRKSIDHKRAMAENPDIDWSRFEKTGSEYRGGLRVSRRKLTKAEKAGMHH